MESVRPYLGPLVAVPALLVLALAPVPATSEERFGAPLTLDRPTPLARVLAHPERWAASPVLVRGRLTDVCQKKGCWTVLRDGKRSARVRFKDYRFFLPKDVIGREALIEGVVSVRTLTKKEARHYESESRAGDAGSVTGPRVEVGLVASSVRLLPLDED